MNMAHLILMWMRGSPPNTDLVLICHRVKNTGQAHGSAGRAPRGEQLQRVTAQGAARSSAAKARTVQPYRRVRA